jgi:hypothetical protein
LQRVLLARSDYVVGVGEEEAGVACHSGTSISSCKSLVVTAPSNRQDRLRPGHPTSLRCPSAA